MTLEMRLWLIAAASLCAFFLLGFSVVHAPSLWSVDVGASALRGRVIPLALVFTTSGRALPLLAVAIAGIVIVAIARANVIVSVAIFASQLLSQGAVELLKHVFRRSRPDAWFINRDLGFSYPSGHATTAIVFFGSWLVFVLMSPLPKVPKIIMATALAVWMAGVDWSRVALGAHYPTDVFGGTLFGVAFACALWALLLHFHYPALKY
ncbi:MAG: phosphatase PAP2 family protein [Candidatus Tumulicola sp.]